MDIKLKYPKITPVHETITHTSTIDPATLSVTEKKYFIDSLYLLHSRIFDGVTKDKFISYVVNSPADHTCIKIYKNSSNEWVGYCAVHRFSKYISGRLFIIFRAEAGLLREYREYNQTLSFAFSETIKYRILHPLRNIYYLGSFVHPSVLYMLSKYFGEYYPQPNKSTPDSIKCLMLKLADIFDLEPVEHQNELVRKVGWVTKESVNDANYWLNNGNPVVKYYIQTNPGYVNGNGLLTLIPLTFNNIFSSLAKFIKTKLHQ